MVTRMRRIFALLTILLALFSLALAGPSKRHHSKPKSSKSHNPKALRGKLSSVHQKKLAVQRQLHVTRVKAGWVKRDITAVNARIDDVQNRLSRTRRDLSGARQDQVKATSDLKAATDALAKARAQARARLRAIAKQGQAPVLVAFAGAKSVGELAERKYFYERIAQKDHELFDRVKCLQQVVAVRKKNQDRVVARVSGLVRQQKNQEAELQDVREEKRQTLAGLNRQAGELESALKQFEEDEAEIRRLIALAAVRPHRGGPPMPAFIGRFMRPVNAPITSLFGSRYHPILHRVRMHAGVDFGAAYGTPVRCAAPGEVIAATQMRGFGNVVIVDHGGGVSTVYGHLSRIGVSRGQRLRQGEYLGNVGNTGLSTGPHLHWEVHIGGTAVNPLGRL